MLTLSASSHMTLNQSTQASLIWELPPTRFQDPAKKVEVTWLLGLIETRQTCHESSNQVSLNLSSHTTLGKNSNKPLKPVFLQPWIITMRKRQTKSTKVVLGLRYPSQQRLRIGLATIQPWTVSTKVKIRPRVLYITLLQTKAETSIFNKHISARSLCWTTLTKQGR